MGNSLTAYLTEGPPEKKAPPQPPQPEGSNKVKYIDEYDVQSKTWRRVPVDADEEYDVIDATKSTKEQTKRASLSLPFLSRWPLLLAVLVPGLLLSLAARLFIFPASAGSASKRVRIDHVRPAHALEPYLHADLSVEPAVISTGAFRRLLADLDAPVALTFALLEEEEDEVSTTTPRGWTTKRHLWRKPDAVVVEKRQDSGLLKCSRPETAACDLAFTPPPPPRLVPTWRGWFLSSSSSER